MAGGCGGGHVTVTWASVPASNPIFGDAGDGLSGTTFCRNRLPHLCRQDEFRCARPGVLTTVFVGRIKHAGSYPAPCRASCLHLQRESARRNSRSPGAIDLCGGLGDRTRCFPNAAHRPIRSPRARQRTTNQLPFGPNYRMDRQLNIQAEAPHRRRQHFQAAIQKRLRRASRTIGAFGFGRDNSYGVNKEICQRGIHSVSDQPLDTCRIFTFPLRVDGQGDVCRPSWNGAGRQENRVAHGFITSTTPIEHSRQHGRIEVGIIVDPNLALPIIEPVQATNVLSNCPMPRHWQREEQRIESGIIKSLANISAGRQQYSLFVNGDIRQSAVDRPDFLPAHAATQHDQVTDRGR